MSLSPLLFLKRRKSGPARISRLTYAIGDIHGRDDLFGRLLDQIADDSRKTGERPRIVLLGDYVDRGLQSRQVLDRILALQTADWCDVVALMGNHEDVLLGFLDDGANGPAWVDYGGNTTLASYGIAAPALRTDTVGWEHTRQALAAVLKGAHLHLLRSLELWFRDGDYFFVHAGVSPGKPLEAQGKEVFLWIRGPFLNVPKACPYVVVHGHTPQENASDTRWRIGLDTGAYATGVLTAIRLQGETRRLMHAR